MFGFSMIQMVRTNADKIDMPLRQKLIHLYRPFRWTPCFLHSSLEKFYKKTKKFSVIIEYDKKCDFTSEVLNLNKITHHHTRTSLKRVFPSVACCSLDLTPAAFEEVLSTCPNVRKIYDDQEVHALLDVATPTVQADNVVRDAQPLTGKDINVAIIDTGIYPHQDLNGRIVAFRDFINNRTEPYDDNGHGTHCAGDAVGNGSASDGVYRAPAYEANVIGVKVLDKMGSGSLSTVMAGVEWCLTYNQTNPDQPIHIISMSLGSTPQRYPNEDSDPMVKIVEEAWRSGIVVCVAAGNSGPDPETIASPGISNEVITVGAMDDLDTTNHQDDMIAVFSSRGPTIYGLTKPDVVAPGTNIISLRSPNSYLDKLQKSSRVGTQYFTLSGTSMSTPITAGVTALILQSDRSLTPEDLKRHLIEGAQPLGDEQTYGYGYINAENSIPE